MSMPSLKSKNQLDCLKRWINSTAEIRIFGEHLNVIF